VLLVLLIGFGMANIFFWSRPLLLAQGLADFPLQVNFWALAAKLALAHRAAAAGRLPDRSGAALGVFLVTVGRSSGAD
jgi:hypothetical protein